MKNLILSVILLFSLSVTAQKKSARPIDPKLTGTWEGSEKDQQVLGMQKHWVMHRFADGTFVLLFMSVTEDGEVDKFTEKGEWWIEGGKFHELHYNSGQTDIYNYEVLDADHIKFRAHKLSIPQEVENYEFIDSRLGEM